MKKFLFAMAGIIFVLVLTQSAQALTSWVYTPNVIGTPETSLTLGFSDVGLGEWDPAAAGIFGAGTHLLSGSTSHTVSLLGALYTWDSYNLAAGYGDVFLIALTQGGYYWELPIIHPVDSDPDDPQLIWPAGGPTSWGGLDWGIGELAPESLNDTGLFTFNVISSNDYYLNIILDTSNGGDMLPSWGNISQFQLRSTSDIPEPATLLLIGSGLAGIGILRRKRSRS